MLTEIISGLWIGDITDAFNERFYKDNLINIVINCTLDQEFINLPNINKTRIPLSSNLTPERDMSLLKNNMDSILTYIHKNIEINNILIYCYTGNTVSGLIVALYMIKYGDISIEHIFEILRSKNENICLDFDLSSFL